MSLYKIEFTQIAIKTVSKYKKSNPGQYKKLVKLLNELIEHPRTGTGHPEPLKSGDSITYSRRISKNDRLIYDIYEEKVTVLVLTVGGRNEVRHDSSSGGKQNFLPKKRNEGFIGCGNSTSSCQSGSRTRPG